MAQAKKSTPVKIKTETAPTKMSRELKADIEKMIARVQGWAEKKFTAIEKQLEQTKGAQGKAKAGDKKVAKKAKPVKTEKKQGKTSKKKGTAEGQVEVVK